MPDMDHLFGNDLSSSSTGDLALVDGDDLMIQRIIRRLMTAVQGYIWHLNYGAGVPERIGNVIDINIIRGIIFTQIGLESSVASIPLPIIKVTEIFAGVFVEITAWSKISGQQITFGFDTTDTSDQS